MSTTLGPGSPNWIDLASPDIVAASKFYGALFGWTAEVHEARIRTWRHEGTDATGTGGYISLSKDGKAVAGIGPATARGTFWSIFFATSNADDNAARVEPAGGKVAMPPADFLDWGRQAVFQDPTGAYFSVWEPAMFKGADLVGEPGSLTWIELITNDVPAATSFYKAVLGVSERDTDTPGTTKYTMLQVGDTPVAGVRQNRTEEGATPSSWSVHFAVDDCDTVAAKAVELGGTELLRDDSTVGRRVFLADPYGATFYIVKRHA